jgi:hypothetical protein
VVEIGILPNLISVDDCDDLSSFCYTPDKMKKATWRAVIEIWFIIFLFYSNLLMGEYTRSGRGHQMGLLWAITENLTPANFAIAITAALVGYITVEFLRRKF